MIRLRRATLRPFRPDDAAARAALGRHAEISRMFGGSPDWTGVRPMSLAEGRAWLENATRDAEAHQWAVEVAGRFVGRVRLSDVDDTDRRARYAIGLLDPDVLGRGLGSEITSGVLGYAFDRLALHRVGLRVLAFNHRAIACYRRCGFVEEGREREAARVDGAWHDEVVMGIVSHEHLGRPHES